MVEQKILEFFGDPDSGLTLKKNFSNMLAKRIRARGRLVSHRAVLKRYGIH